MRHGRLRGEAERRDATSHGAGALPGQQIDDLLVGDRHEKSDRLGGNQRAQREQHATAEIRPVSRPDIRKQLLKHGDMTRPRLKHGVAPRLRQPVLH